MRAQRGSVSCPPRSSPHRVCLSAVLFIGARFCARFSSVHHLSQHKTHCVVSSHVCCIHVSLSYTHTFAHPHSPGLSRDGGGAATHGRQHLNHPHILRMVNHPTLPAHRSQSVHSPSSGELPLVHQTYERSSGVRKKNWRLIMAAASVSLRRALARVTASMYTSNSSTP